jgi:poly(hydroxyalkanoate) granule-associated protein
MAKSVEVKVEEQAEEQPKPFAVLFHKVMLAGMGAMALTQEELEKFVTKLVERGELAEQEGKKMVQEVMEKRKTSTKKAENQVDSRMEDLLDRMNVPTKSDIDALSSKITALTKKVDELKQS